MARPPKSNGFPQLQRFLGADDLWYWRLVGRNGRIVAIGGEGFAKGSNATRSIRAVSRILGKALDKAVVEVANDSPGQIIERRRLQAEKT